MNNLYKQDLVTALSIFLKIEPLKILPLISLVPKDQVGHFSLPCFFLAKSWKCTPVQIAEKIATNFSLPGVFSKVVAVKGYLNFELNQKQFCLDVLKNIVEKKHLYGGGNEGNKQTVTLDFSSPNMGKELAFHHLRGTMLGKALSCLFVASGYQVVRINYLGDWGTSYGKLIVMYLKLKEQNSDVQASNMTIENLNSLYSQFSKEVEKDLSFDDQARLVFKKLEEGDSQYYELWKIFREITLKELERIYTILGVKFDSYKGEAFFVKKTKHLVDTLAQQGLTIRSEGATIVDLKKFDMMPLLLKKTDGSTLYSTRDICAAIFRYEQYQFKQNLYVVDIGQSLHFKQVFKVLELMNMKWVSNCKHIPFGLILNQNKSGKWEKGKTRTGEVSLLKDVLQEATDKILQIINQKNPELEDKENIATKIAVAALTFNDLKHKRKNNVKFEWTHALSFEGDSGPYILNAYVRIKSILMKYLTQSNVSVSNWEAIDWIDKLKKIEMLDTCFQEEQTQELIYLLSSLSEKREKSLQMKEPCILAQYILNLADAIHRFVHHCRILHSPKQEERIVLIVGAQLVLKNALNWIGIEPVENM